MSQKCETVIISDKAYNAIIRESFAKHPVETGGILLGYILDNGLWVVMEMIPPGINGVFETAYFEYDRDFVNYLGTSVANQYREPLQVLGLWHRHPGSMDYFSKTDDGTNSEFASHNPYGVISGLVNIDPKFRLTMYHLDHNSGARPQNIAYTTVDVEVGDDLIPDKFFALRYVDENRSELHPTPSHSNTREAQTRPVPRAPRNGGEEEWAGESKPGGDAPAESQGGEEPPATGVKQQRQPRLRSWVYWAAGLAVFLLGCWAGNGCTSKSYNKDIKEFVLIGEDDQPEVLIDSLAKFIKSREIALDTIRKGVGENIHEEDPPVTDESSNPDIPDA